MYKDVLWVQAGYQTNKSISAMLGVKIENLSIGYGFRFNNKDFKTVSSGSHEVTLGFRIPQRAKGLGSSPISDNASLNEIIARLDKLSKENVTAKNRENIKAELEKIKLLLQRAEMDNSSPEKAQEVSKQLLQIDEKLKMIEKNLLNEN
jgi:hypothetical protein